MTVTDSDNARGGNVSVITGASSGIGESFARRFASDGDDLVLIARRKELLNQLAQELNEEFGVRAEVVPADLTLHEDLDRVAERIAELPAIQTFVHAAGFGYMGDFVDLPMDKHMRMLDLHIRATVQLCYAALPKMIEANNGTIINVSSLAAWTVGPGQAMYNSTKAFVKTFTESLHAELDQTGVHVQALCPGVTHTGFHDTEEFRDFDRSEMPGSWMTPQDVVEESVAALRRDRAVCVPGFNNRVLSVLFRSDRIRRIAGEKVRKRPK